MNPYMINNADADVEANPDETKAQIERLTPDYLYAPDKCPCPRGPEVNCPRFRDCSACIAFHKSNPNTPKTACERWAVSEGICE